MYGASGPFWYLALKKVQHRLHTRLIPRLALFAAFSFVIMMFNVPLPGGTSGHATGVGLATVVLGPWGGMLALSTALLIQALFFGDGGITAYGANAFNMAIAGCLVTYIVYRLLAKAFGKRPWSQPVAAGLAGYIAINFSALLAAIEFGIQPLLFKDAAGHPLYAPFPLSISIPAMLIGHLTIAGLAECFITAGVVTYLQKSSPEIILLTPSRLNWKLAFAVLTVLIALTPLGLLTIGRGWGEWSAQDFQNAHTRTQIQQASGGTPFPANAPSGLQRLQHLWSAPLRDYAPSFISNASAGYVVSAVSGVTLLMLLALALNALVNRRRRGHHFENSA